MSVASLHPVVARAADGQWPAWTRADRARRAHMERVAGLLDAWARASGLDDEERARWRAHGYLHDALKDEPAAVLREIVAPEFRDLPDPVLHGPGVAARLRHEGVADERLLRALAYHTLGHPDLDATGRALYAADFLEPGRDLRNKWRAELRERMPSHADDVVREIVRARLGHLLKRARPIRPETLAFWNRMTEGQAWVRASEV